MKNIAIVAAAALLAAPAAFAQSAVTSSTGVTVSSGTGVVVTPGAPSASTATKVTVAPSAAMPSPHLLPGGAVVQNGSTTVLGGPSGNVAGTKTEVNTYWVNVPADAPRDAGFRRWQSLK